MVTTLLTEAASYLLGSKVGRVILMVLLGVILVSIILWRVYALGGKNVEAGQTEKQLVALKHKIEVDRDIRSLSPDARRAALREWVRN